MKKKPTYQELQQQIEKQDILLSEYENNFDAIRNSVYSTSIDTMFGWGDNCIYKEFGHDERYIEIINKVDMLAKIFNYLEHKNTKP